MRPFMDLVRAEGLIQDWAVCPVILTANQTACDVDTWIDLLRQGIEFCFKIHHSIASFA